MLLIIFFRLFEVKWTESLDDLLLLHHQVKIDKQDIGFNSEKSILCNLETSQIVCHTQGGRGYCLGRATLNSGSIYQWKFKLLRDPRGNEGIFEVIFISENIYYFFLTGILQII